MSLVRLNDDLSPAGVQAFKMVVEEKKTKKSSSLDVLTKFIPTEMLAPYVAFLAYASDNNNQLDASAVYWWAVALTPALSLFFEYAKRAMDNEAWPNIKLVIWRAIAATVAFAVWGLAPPGSAYQPDVGGPAVAGLAAFFVSPILTGADAIVLRLIGIKKVAE